MMLGIPLHADGSAPAQQPPPSSLWGPPQPATQAQPQMRSSEAAAQRNPWDASSESNDQTPLSPGQAHLRSLLMAAAQSSSSNSSGVPPASPWGPSRVGESTTAHPPNAAPDRGAYASASLHSAPLMHDPPPSLGELPWAMGAGASSTDGGGGSGGGSGAESLWPGGGSGFGGFGQQGVGTTSGLAGFGGVGGGNDGSGSGSSHAHLGGGFDPHRQSSMGSSTGFPVQLGGFGFGHSLGPLPPPMVRGPGAPRGAFPPRGPAPSGMGGGAEYLPFGMPRGMPSFATPSEIQQMHQSRAFGQMPGGGGGWGSQGPPGVQHDAAAFDVQRQLDQLSLDVARGRAIVPPSGGGSFGPLEAQGGLRPEAAGTHFPPRPAPPSSSAAPPMAPPTAVSRNIPSPSAADAFRHHAGALARPVDAFTAHILAAIKDITPAPGEEERQAQVIEFLSRVVRRRWPTARVLVYGSTASGFALRGSDCDATMVIADSPDCNKYVCALPLRLCDPSMPAQ